MPAKRKYNKNKKNYNRKKRFTGPKSLSLGPYMPNSIIARHKFNYSFDLTQPYNSNIIGSSNMNNFRINSLRDPDLSVAPNSGGSFKFYDEMGQFYQTYRVIGAKAIIKIINLCSEPVYVHTLLGNTQLSASGSLNNQALAEMKGVRSAIVHGVNTGPKSIRNIVMTYSPEKVEGKKKSEIRGDNHFESVFGTDPSELHYLSCCASQVSDSLGSSVDMNVKVEVTVHATAIWNDRKILQTGGQ
jgi:hypothetical protein